MEENSLLVLFQNRSSVGFLNGLKVSDRKKKKQGKELAYITVLCILFLMTFICD